MNLSPPIEVVVTEPPASVLQAFCSSSCGFATSRETGPAMSQENVDIVAGTIAAFNRGDLDAGSDYWSDDLDYRAAQGAPADPGPIILPNALRPDDHDEGRHDLRVRFRLHARHPRAHRRRRRRHRGHEDWRTREV